MLNKFEKSSTRRTLKEHAYNLLKERILTGKLNAGQSLIEMELARELGISRTPIREAILRLEKDALVEVLPNRGAYVSFISLKDLKDSIQLLQILEGAAAKMAADRIDAAKLEMLERAFLALKNKRNASYAEEQKIGIELHELILQEAGNAKLIAVSNSVREQIRALSNASIKAPGRVVEAILEHLAIIEALKNRDGKSAEKAMIEHLEKVYKTLVKLIS